MGLLDRYNKNLNAGPAEKKKQMRLNTSTFAIVIGIMTIIGSFIIPAMYNIDLVLLQTEIIVSCALGALFVVAGFLFIKFDHIAVAIVMLLLFLGYVGDKIYSIASGSLLADNAAIYFWLILGIMQIFTICSYLALKAKKADATPEQIAEIIQEISNTPDKIIIEPTDQAAGESAETVFCQTCGLKNNRSAKNCTGCNAPLKE